MRRGGPVGPKPVMVEREGVSTGRNTQKPGPQKAEHSV